MPTVLLAYGSKAEIEATVREYCEKLGTGDGWDLGPSSSIRDGILLENFVTMTQAVRRDGRYGDLGLWAWVGRMRRVDRVSVKDQGSCDIGD